MNARFTKREVVLGKRAKSVQARLFELTVQDLKQRNREYSQDEILQAIDDALASE